MTWERGTVLPSVPEVLDKLAALGSARQIADFLLEQEMKAYPVRVNACAVAVYLQKETGMQVTVHPGHFLDETMIGQVNIPGQRTPVNLPKAVQKFACEFDRWTYPDLIADDADPDLRASNEGPGMIAPKKPGMV